MPATAAPAAAPAKPAAAEPAPTTTAPPPPSPADYLGDIVGDLEALDKATPEPKAPAKPADDKGKVKPPDKANSQPTGETQVDHPIDPKPADKPPEAPAKPVRAAELRTAYENLKKEANETLRPTIQRLEARVKELETSPADTKPLQEKLSALEKRNQELERHIAFVDYSKSTEFQQKYEQPFNEAWARAVRDFSQLSVRVPDGVDDLEQPKFKLRPATADDLLALAQMPLSQMDEQAEAMFGRSHARVINHVEKIRELYAVKEKALADAQKTASERATTTQAQTRAQTEATVKAFEDTTKAIVTKYPAIFGPDESDPKGNTLLQRGFAEVDRMFRPTQETMPKTTQEAIELHARIRLKAANHDRLALRLKNLRAELEETKKALAEYEQSEPTAGKGGEGGKRTASLDPMADAEAELREMDR